MTTKEIGDIGEMIAVKHLKKNRYKILHRNLHVSHNEIDVIAIHKKTKTIAFVEVKTRSVNDDLYSPFGTPASAVTKKKQIRTLQAARGFLNDNPKYNRYQPRFDIVEVYLKKDDKTLLNVNHFENAFGI